MIDIDHLTLMADRQAIADTVRGEPFNKLRLRDGVDEFLVPGHLFRGGREVGMDRFCEWLRGRIIQPDRTDIRQRLSEMGLREYDLWGIVENTKASRQGDPWWVRTDEADTFEENTLRGLLGIEPMG
jgi:hypothetical protein